MPFEKQLSVFVQNKVGSLAKLCSELAEANVNIKSLTIADDLDWGIVRLIVDNPDKAKEILHQLNFMYGEGNVLTTEIKNHPGAIAVLANKLTKMKINIEHMFTTTTGENCLLVLTTTDDKKANTILMQE